MSYFSRLRQQSGLVFRDDSVAPAPVTRGDGPAVFDELDVITLVEPAPDPGVTTSRAETKVVAASVQSAAPAPAGAPRASTPALPAASAVGLERQTPPTAAPAPRVVQAAPVAAGASQKGEVQPSVQTTLHHVFEWIAAAPPPDATVGVPPPPAPVAREETPWRDVAPAVETIGMPPPVSRPSNAPEVRRPAESSRTEVTAVEVLEPAHERQPRAPVNTRSSPERAVPTADVEEVLTVSIGAIHLRVEAPAPAVATAPRPAAPASPRQERSKPRSRLARHYLRP